MPSTTQKGGLGYGYNNPWATSSSYGYTPYFQGYGFNPFQGYSSPVMENGMSSGVLQYFYYFLMLTIILLVVLILIHFTIIPIFKLRPGEKGLIDLPGSDDSKLYWATPTSIAEIQDINTPLGTHTENWSFLLDIQVDNPTANTDRPRILFTRGAKLIQPTTPFLSTDTILTINPSFNVCVFLDRMTNDLNISVQTNTNNNNAATLQSIIVPNIPVGKSIRLGVFVGSKMLEVYVNGYLVRSKGFPDSLISVTGPLQPPLNTILSGTARVSNLRIWNRAVSPSEFRSWGAGSNFTVIATQDSCVSSSSGASSGSSGASSGSSGASSKSISTQEANGA